jgi:hypothetical protein
MTTTTARLASGKLNDRKGITDEAARTLFDNLGTTRMAVVELKSREHSESADDKQVVTLEVIGLELADTLESADHLRELQRALWRKREPQTDIDSLIDVEPTEDDVLARGAAILADAEVSFAEPREPVDA